MFLMSNYCLYVLVRSSSYTTTITISHHCGWNGLFVLVIVIVIVIVIVWVCSWTRVIHDTPFVVAIAVAVVVCTVDLVVLPNQLGLPCIHITHIGHRDHLVCCCRWRGNDVDWYYCCFTTLNQHYITFARTVPYSKYHPYSFFSSQSILCYISNPKWMNKCLLFLSFFVCHSSSSRFSSSVDDVTAWNNSVVIIQHHHIYESTSAEGGERERQYLCTIMNI